MCIRDSLESGPYRPRGRTTPRQSLRRSCRRGRVFGNNLRYPRGLSLIHIFIKELDEPVSYMVVSEAGASVYSASKLAAEEFPQFDVSLRSAVSIARRLQDPLAELVKIDPKAIGVGQYQHDMAPKQLSEALDGVVESCVNLVGVDLNTASQPLLAKVAGINSGCLLYTSGSKTEIGRPSWTSAAL